MCELSHVYMYYLCWRAIHIC